MSRRREVSLDTEATGLNVWTGDRPFAVSACFDDGDTLWWQAPVDPATRKPRWKQKQIREINLVTRDRSLRKSFWNAKYDWLMLDAVGVEVPIPDVDEVMFMAKAVNNLEFSYELKHLAKKYVDEDADDQKALHDAVVKSRRLAKKLGYPVADEVEADKWLPYSLNEVHPDEIAAAGIDVGACETYGVRDATRTMLLAQMYRVAMRELNVRKIYDLEMELWPVTLDIERRGVRIDPERMQKVRADCLAMVDKHQAILASASRNRDFNINSPQQVAALLFEGDDALPVLKRTKTGQPKTDAEALAPHKRDPRVEAVFRVRANTKAVRDFFDKYDRLATADDDDQVILHPGCRQWGTLTSRYSMSEPNLHAVSDPDTSNSLAAEFMVDIRQVFVPRSGYVWYCPDYSQVEVIIFASISGEPTMIEAIRRGEDVHGATCEKIWSGRGNPRAVPAAMELLGTRDEGKARALLEAHGWSVGAAEKSLDKKIFRKKAKSVTFTKIFGGGPLALMRWIGVGKVEAKQILNAYDDSFPTMVDRMREIEARGKKDGFITGSFGQRLGVDPWNAYRAVNHHVQGDAAQLMKMGMRKTNAYLKETELDARILLTIHDELIFEFKKEHAFKHVLREIVRLMGDHEGVFCIPTPVDMDKVTERWSDKQKVDLAA